MSYHISAFLQCASEGDRDCATKQYRELLRQANSIAVLDQDLAKRYLQVAHSLLHYSVAGSLDFLMTSRMILQHSNFLLNLKQVQEYKAAQSLALSYFPHFFEELKNGSLKNLDQTWSAEVILYLRQNYQKDLTIEKIASDLKMNSRTMSSKFKRETGMTMKPLINQIRLTMAAEKLLSTEDSEQEIALAVGYQDIQAFRKAFKLYFHITPFQFRKSNFKR